jgi:hypothetical protein
LVIQWFVVSVSWVTDSTPDMKFGKDSNCVHWLYAVLTGTPTSMVASTVSMIVLLWLEYSKSAVAD